MAPGVPGQRRHAIADPHAVLAESLRQLQRSPAGCGVGRAVDPAFDRTGHDRPVGMVDRGMIDDPVAEQWPILHQAEHGVSPCLVPLRSRLLLMQPSMRATAGAVTCYDFATVVA